MPVYMTKRIGYARVSTLDQMLDGQILELKKAGCDIIFTEKDSGKNDDRTELEKALSYLREGDTFIVYKLDRLARSVKKLIEVYERLEKLKVEIVSINEKLDSSTASGRAMIKMIGIFAEMEREIIVDRVKNGLAAARARGRLGGRPKTDPKKVHAAVLMYESNQHSIAEIEEATGVKKATLYRALKRINFK